MAKNKSTVYLGFEDEEITIKHSGMLNSTVNKIGGTPDWPNGEVKVPACPLCGTARPLIVQLYTPLELSQFHRTLYVFACLNSVCSQSSRGWVCVRTQYLDTQNAGGLISAVPAPLLASFSKKRKNGKQQGAAAMQSMAWCTGADDWGESFETYDEMDTEADDIQNQNEENGNVISKNDNSAIGRAGAGGASFMGSEEEDDDEDESNSMENDLVCGFGQLDLHAPPNAMEDPNANCAAGVAGAAGDGMFIGGGAATASFCAEIEGAETDVVLVETPKKPERDLIALLKHTPSPAIIGPLAEISDVTLKPYFMGVDVEMRYPQSEYEYYGGGLSADHIRELYQEYKMRDEAELSPNGGGAGCSFNGAGVAEEQQEMYEKSLPPHGDVVFHHFISTVQQNPGQILRYSRDALPLLITPLREPVPKCQHCNGETICEVQILSTLIPRLRYDGSNQSPTIDYGNVLVFTCLNSCWDTPEKMRFERVIVQEEPQVNILKPHI